MRTALCMHHMHHMSTFPIDVGTLLAFLVILSATSSIIFNFDAMPLTRTFSFTALDNPDYAPPVPSSVSCHSQVPAGSLPCKPFVKPPTIPFDRLSFIRQSSPLAPSHNFPTLSVLRPPKKLAPSKPRFNLYRKTLISYWRQNRAHRRFSKNRAVQGCVSMKRTPKKSFTTVANLPVEEKGFENVAV
jgi:hypothetical protein